MNYLRQSTAGLSIVAILLDLTGAALSLMQLVLDWGVYLTAVRKTLIMPTT
jgi:hypothetical protein